MSDILSLFPGIYRVLDNGCWEYTGDQLNKRGRPTFRIGDRGGLLARLLCAEEHGPPSDLSMHAAHSCHYRKCINPGHLFWQDAVDNMLDQRSQKVHDLPANIRKREAGYAISIRINGVRRDGYAATLDEAIAWRDAQIEERAA